MRAGSPRPWLSGQSQALLNGDSWVTGTLVFGRRYHGHFTWGS